MMSKKPKLVAPTSRGEFRSHFRPDRGDLCGGKGAWEKPEIINFALEVGPMETEVTTASDIQGITGQQRTWTDERIIAKEGAVNLKLILGARHR